MKHVSENRSTARQLTNFRSPLAALGMVYGLLRALTSAPARADDPPFYDFLFHGETTGSSADLIGTSSVMRVSSRVQSVNHIGVSAGRRGSHCRCGAPQSSGSLVAAVRRFHRDSPSQTWHLRRNFFRLRLGLCGRSPRDSSLTVIPYRKDGRSQPRRYIHKNLV